MVSPLNQKLRQLFFLLLAVGCLLLLTDCPAQTQRFLVRVRILGDAISARLRVKGFYEIQDSLRKKSLSRGKNLNTTVTVYKGSIMLRNLNLNTEKILIKADDPEAICVNERRFRGNIQFIKKDNARFLAINYIELEDYIKGVLYHEASHYWPMEALKAQAVAVRTFALYQMQENASLDYDVTSDIYSQVYGGKTSERYRTNRAVAQTSGQILVYQDKVFPAYYHATCGGHTEDASLLWKTDIVPLKGVVCGFCKDSPHFNWHYVLSLAQIQEKLAGAGYKAGNIKDVVILNRNKSGRATDLKIITTQQEMKISAKDLRNILGPNMVRSLDFTVNIIDHDIVFEGLGWGHGVGMCQWGSYFMAKQGRNYQEILKYYYPGSYFLNY